MLDVGTIEERAKRAAGNHRKFDSFGWNGAPDDRDDWTLVYTNNRDSGLMDQSNAAAIALAMERFIDADEPDCINEHHGHWAVGWVDGYAIRVYREGQVTEAFREWCELVDALESYPVLDDEDHSRREYEATLENLRNALWGEAREYVLPDGWESECFSWFWDYDQSAVENCDDQGGWPSEEQLVAAFTALGYEREAE